MGEVPGIDQNSRAVGLDENSRMPQMGDPHAPNRRGRLPDARPWVRRSRYSPSSLPTSWPVHSQSSAAASRWMTSLIMKDEPARTWHRGDGAARSARVRDGRRRAPEALTSLARQSWRGATGCKRGTRSLARLGAAGDHLPRRPGRRARLRRADRRAAGGRACVLYDQVGYGRSTRLLDAARTSGRRSSSSASSTRSSAELGIATHTT